MTYPIRLERDTNGTTLVTFPDFPEAQTFGDTKEDAMAHAVDALATIIDAYLKDRRPLPAPSKGRTRVTLPALVTLKVALADAMRAQRVNKSELARRMNVHLPQIDRLLTASHASTFEQIEAALHALGKRLVVSTEDADRKSASREVECEFVEAAMARASQPAIHSDGGDGRRIHEAC